MMASRPISSKFDLPITPTVVNSSSDDDSPAPAAPKPGATAKKMLKGRLQAFSLLGKSSKKLATPAASFAVSAKNVLSSAKSRLSPKSNASASSQSPTQLPSVTKRGDDQPPRIPSLARANSEPAVRKPAILKDITNVSYGENTTQILKNNDLQFMQLRMNLLKQPSGQSSHHDKSVRNRMASPDIAERHRILMQNVQRSEQVSTVTFQNITAEVSKDTHFNLLSLRNNLLKLPANSARPYQQLLGEVLASKDPDQRNRLVNQMSKQVEDHLKKSASVEFMGVTAEIPKSMQLDFMQMRLNLMKLPYARKLKYNALVQDIMLSKDNGKRDQLLGDIAKQVAQETT